MLPMVPTPGGLLPRSNGKSGMFTHHWCRTVGRQFREPQLGLSAWNTCHVLIRHCDHDLTMVNGMLRQVLGRTQFLRMCRDCLLIDQSLDPVALNLMFEKVSALAASQDKPDTLSYLHTTTEIAMKFGLSSN